MIYITRDTHANFSTFLIDKFPIQNEMTKDDYIIKCGSFGGIWSFEEESSYEKEMIDGLDSKNFTTLFVDGNHENYTRLYNYPVENGMVVEYINKKFRITFNAWRSILN